MLMAPARRVKSNLPECFPGVRLNRPFTATVSIVLLALAAVAAGCVSPAGQVEAGPNSAAAIPAGWWEHAVPSSLTDPDHDHSDRSQHANLTTANFQVVGYDPLVTDHYGETPTGMGCGGAITREDGRRIAIVHTISTDVAFVVADVTDPAKPVKLGEYLMPNAVIWDADITADGMHVLVGAYPPIFGDPTPQLPPVASAIEAPAVWKFQPMWRDACTGEVSAAGPEQYLPFGPGIVMVGIQDPTSPTFEDWAPQPVIGPHSVSSALVDGTLYATASVTNLQHESSYYTIFEIVGPKLVPLHVIEVPGHPGPFEFNGHIDVAIHKHPVTGQILAHLANWDAYYIYDISGPVAMEVSKALAEGSIHTTYPLPVMWGDKHYTIVAQEVGEPVDLPSGWTYVMDTTDPANPVEVGRWTLPVKPKWDDGGLQFSPHYVAVLNTTLFVTNYHGGMWAVDMSNPADLAAVGIFVPANDSPMPFEGGSYGPGIEDVIVDPTTGLLTVWDNAGGVYQLRYDESNPAPRAPAWPAS